MSPTKNQNVSTLLRLAALYPHMDKEAYSACHSGELHRSLKRYGFPELFRNVFISMCSFDNVTEKRLEVLLIARLCDAAGIPFRMFGSTFDSFAYYCKDMQVAIPEDNERGDTILSYSLRVGNEMRTTEQRHGFWLSRSRLVEDLRLAFPDVLIPMKEFPWQRPIDNTSMLYCVGQAIGFARLNA